MALELKSPPGKNVVWSYWIGEEPRRWDAIAKTAFAACAQRGHTLGQVSRIEWREFSEEY